MTATLLAEFPHENVADADTLTINGIKVVATEATAPGGGTGDHLGAGVGRSADGEVSGAALRMHRPSGTVAEDAPSPIAGTIAITEGADQDATLAVTLVSPATFQGGATISFTLGAAGSTQSATVLSGTGDVLGVLSVTTASGRCDVVV